MVWLSCSLVQADVGAVDSLNSEANPLTYSNIKSQLNRLSMLRTQGKEVPEHTVPNPPVPDSGANAPSSDKTAVDKKVDPAMDKRSQRKLITWEEMIRQRQREREAWLRDRWAIRWARRQHRRPRRNRLYKGLEEPREFAAETDFSERDVADAVFDEVATEESQYHDLTEEELEELHMSITDIARFVFQMKDVWGIVSGQDTRWSTRMTRLTTVTRLCGVGMPRSTLNELQADAGIDRATVKEIEGGKFSFSVVKKLVKFGWLKERWMWDNMNIGQMMCVHKEETMEWGRGMKEAGTIFIEAWKDLLGFDKKKKQKKMLPDAKTDGLIDEDSVKEDIKDATDKAGKVVDDMVDKTKKKTEEAVDKTKDKVDDAVEKAKKIIPRR